MILFLRNHFIFSNYFSKLYYLRALLVTFFSHTPGFLENCPYDFDQTWHVASYSYGGLGGSKFMPVALLGDWEFSRPYGFAVHALRAFLHHNILLSGLAIRLATID